MFYVKNITYRGSMDLNTTGTNDDQKRTKQLIDVCLITINRNCFLAREDLPL